MNFDGNTILGKKEYVNTAMPNMALNGKLRCDKRNETI